MVLAPSRPGDTIPAMTSSFRWGAVLLTAGTLAGGAERWAADPEAARKAVEESQPGDHVVLAPGEWRDVDLILSGRGEPGKPIAIRAAEPDKTVITGASRVRLAGEHLAVSGLWLRNLTGTGADWLEFRLDSKRRANHCRLTDCALTEDAGAAPREGENRWIGLYGEDNQIDRCHVAGKKNRGATLVVWLGTLDPGGHRILRNAFDGRLRLGENGGETLRIGDSKTSMRRAGCLVEGNVFRRCDGETECISNKSCGNVYRGNWFIETQGTLTLRHGNDCVVEGNVFLGGLRGQTGGIRLIGEGHRVTGNQLRDLEGDGFRSAICLVNGIPDSPDNGYHQVRRAVIEDNTLVNCKESLLIGHHDAERATLAPSGCRFEGNRIRPREGRPAVRMERPATGTVWAGNAHEGTLEGMAPVEGLSRTALSPPEPPRGPAEGTVGAGWMPDRR